MTADYIDKTAAAMILGVGDRRALQILQGAGVRTTQGHSPRSGQELLLFHSADVARVAEERKKPAKPDPAAVVTRPLAAPANGMPAMLRAVLEAQLHQQQHAVGGFLTLAEASAAVRLSETALRRLVKGGQLPALIDEPVRADGETRARPGSSLRFSRRDLDELRGVRQHGEQA